MRVDDLLRCPACKNAGLVEASGEGRELVCPDCAARFPVRDGVIDLIPGFQYEPSPAQRLMEWAPLVRIYESRLWRRNPLVALRMGIRFEDEYDRIERAGAFTEADRVLDLACGPGIYARRFARAIPEGRVVGLDLSPAMLGYAARRVREEGIDNLLLVHGDAGELPFDTGTFDAVNCCGALHLFPDPDRVLAEVCRVLRAEGCFTAAVFHGHESGLRSRIERIRARYAGIQAFTQRGLAEQLATAGLSDFDCLHASGLWMLASAHKPLV